MNRAFSADYFLFLRPGALPQADDDTAPLALVSQTLWGIEMSGLYAPTALSQPEPGATPQGS